MTELPVSPVFLSARTNPYLSLQHATVFVRDFDRSISFYVEKLGFLLAIDQRFDGGGRWVAVAPPDGTALLVLFVPPPDSDEYRLIGRFTSITFVTEDVDVQYRAWLERGVRFQQPPHVPDWGGLITFFEDVDGNAFALVGYDEVTRTLEAHRRAEEGQREAERLAAYEMDIAQQVQARLFPQTHPRMETLDYAGTCLQARRIGGDYYDFLDLGGGRLGLALGDIVGKGIAAALLMANLQANVRSQAAVVHEDLESFMQCVNRLLNENTGDSAYATLIFAEYDDQSRQLRYLNCGHPPGFVLRSDGSVQLLEATATLLGMFEPWECSVETCTLQPGDLLVLYSDGVTEAFHEGGEEYGLDRLIEAVRGYRNLPVQDLAQTVVQEVCRFSAPEQDDDITLVAARCR